MIRSLVVEEGVGKLASRVKYLLPGPQLFPPLLHLQTVLLIQLLQLLCLMFDQEVTFLILQHVGDFNALNIPLYQPELLLNES